MRDRRRRDSCVLRRLGEDESTLQHGLCVQRQTVGIGFAAAAAGSERLGDVGFERRRVADDAARAGVADRWAGVVYFLHHRADEAGEFGNGALQDRGAEVDVAEHAVACALQSMVGRCGKECAGDCRPMIGGGHREVSFAREVVEERAFADASGRAQIIYRGRVVALGAHEAESGSEQALAGGRCHLAISVGCHD